MITLKVKNYPKAKTILKLCVLFLLLFLTVPPATIFASANRTQREQETGITWKVTQYGNKSDTKQSMFYSIKGSNGKTILIDGGWKSDETKVRKVIQKLGGKVDLWIITHPHPDHAGAFNQIAANPKKIRIGRVYAPKVNAKVYRRYAKAWDEYDVFTEFTRQLKKQKKVTYLKEGDSFDFYNLHFAIYSSYYRGISRKTKDICNDSSLVFKIVAPNTSILFTGDINKKTGNRLIKKYGRLLRSTYLQAPHHGNNKGRNSFFKAVRPKKVFVDAASYLCNYPGVRHNLAVLKKLKYKTMVYGSGKNTVKLR